MSTQPPTETRPDQLDRPWDEIHRLLEESPEELASYFYTLPATEVARTLSQLEDQEQHSVLAALPPETSAELCELLPEVHATDLLTRLEPSTAAAIIEHLPSDEQADILHGMEPAVSAAILEHCDPEEAPLMAQLSAYPDDVAGGLMITEYLAYPATQTVRELLVDLEANAEEYRDYDVQYAYVVDADDTLVGVLRLRDLLLAPRDTKLGALMVPDPITVSDDTPLDALRDFFDEHYFLGVPVVSDSGALLGVLRSAAVEEALADRAEDDYRKAQGIVGGEELRTMPLALRSRRRLSWLSINIVLNIIAASVIAFYQETLAAVIALAVFLPIISDMSGCSGAQAVAVSMRELSLNLIRPVDAFRVWLKEVSLGLVNGAALGILIALVAWVWKDSLLLGAVVGGALMINTVVAVSIGGVVPLLLRGLKMDPALASGPILTTITDLCGFFLVLSFASLALPYLDIAKPVG